MSQEIFGEGHRIEGAYRLVAAPEGYEALQKLQQLVSEVPGFIPAPLGSDPIDPNYAQGRSDYRETNFPHVSFFARTEERDLKDAWLTDTRLTEFLRAQPNDLLFRPARFKLTGDLFATRRPLGRIIMARLVGEEDDPRAQRQAVQDAFQSLTRAEFTPDWRHAMGVVVGRIIRPHRVRGVISALRDAAAPFECTLPTESVVFTRDKIHKGPAGLGTWLGTKTATTIGIATAPEGQLEPPEKISAEHEANEPAEEAPWHAEVRLTDILPWVDVSVDPRLTQLEPDHLRLLQLPGEVRGPLTEKVAAAELGVGVHVARALLGKLVLLGLVEEEKRRAYSIYRLRSRPLLDELEA